MTEPNQFSLDPELLESFGIIRQSRAGWAAVTTAVNRLETLKQARDPYNEMESDRDDVLAYADVVRRSGDVIAYAAALGVHLARFVPIGATPQKRFSDGLRVLSEGLALRQLDETKTRSEMVRCMRALLESDQLPFDQWKADQIDKDWVAKLESLLEQIHALPLPEDIRKHAWEGWQTRLLATIRGTGEVLGDLNYLRCRAEDSSPGTILSADLKSLLLSDWSAAFVKSMSGVADARMFCPLWFSYGVLCAVGFDAGPELLDVTRPGDRQELETTRQFLQQIGSTTTPRKGTIVVRAKAGSLTSTWMSVRTTPALCLTVDEFPGYQRVDLQAYFMSRLHGLLVEIEPADSAADVQQRIAKLKERLPVARVALIARAPRSDVSAFPVIVNPRDLASAIGPAFDAATTAA